MDAQSGATFTAKVAKGQDAYALKFALEAIKFCGRSRLIVMVDQESAVKVLADLVYEHRSHETSAKNTPKGSSQSAGLIERSNYEVERQFRTLRSNLEDVYGTTLNMSHPIMPFMVRHAAWQITMYMVKEDGKTPHERLFK